MFTMPTDKSGASLTELAVHVLKLVAITSAALFGSFGVLKETKKKDGTLTDWGRIALAGVIVSAVVSVAIQQLEYVDQNRRATSAAQEANATAERLQTVLVTGQEGLQKLRGVQDTAQNTLGTQERILQEQQGFARDLKKNNDRLDASVVVQQAVAKQAAGIATSQEHILEKQKESIFQAQRGLLPLKPIAFEFTSEYTLNDPKFAKYVQRLESLAVKLPGVDAYDSTGLLVFREANRLEKIIVSESSPWFPSAQDGDAYYILARATYRWSVFTNQSSKDNNSPALSYEIHGWTGGFGKPASGHPEFDGAKTTNELTIDFERNVLIQDVFTNAARAWKDDGRIVSVLDLPGTIIGLQFTCACNLTDYIVAVGDGYARRYWLDPLRLQSEIVRQGDSQSLYISPKVGDLGFR